MNGLSHDLLTSSAERLVISGYRNMLAAYELGDCSCWEEIWRAFALELGPHAARRAIGEVQYWARTLCTCSGRPLSFSPDTCMQLCDDECIALSLVAAAQKGDCGTGLLAGELLTGTERADRVTDVWQASLHLATALRNAGQVIHACPRRIIARAGMVPPSFRRSLSHFTLN